MDGFAVDVGRGPTCRGASFVSRVLIDLECTGGVLTVGRRFAFRGFGALRTDVGVESDLG